MATISFNIPDTLIPEVIEAFGAQYSYQAQIPDPNNPQQLLTNPEDAAAFARRMFVQFGKDVVKAHAVKLAAAQAVADATAAAQARIDAAVISVSVQ
jgi:hypothetical protein